MGPNLKQANDAGVLWIFEMIYNKWGAEALVSSYLTSYSSVYDMKVTADFYGYTLGRYSTDLLYMLLVGTVTRVIGFGFLLGFNSSEDY